MKKSSSKSHRYLIILALGLLGLAAWSVGSFERTGVQPASAQSSCFTLTSPKELLSPVLINFDSLPNAAVIGNSYKAAFGVSFEDTKVTRAIIFGNEPARTHSSPNVASNDAVFPNTSANVPMLITFDTPKSQVGFYVGNGGVTAPTSGLLVAYDSANNAICRVPIQAVPNSYTLFVGVSFIDNVIKTISLDYGNTTLSEAIDDLYFAPGPGIQATRTPQPAWTPVPSFTPTPGATATPTAVVPVKAYHNVVINPSTFLFTPDFAIHGIEITQGIQCFDTSKGLTGCADNSLPVVTKKDTTARIYLKAVNSNSVYNNVPVRLHIFANGVWYQADAAGKTTLAVNQAAAESANIYFNVNFNSAVPVQFYAEVDPNNLYSETSKTNNRFPASGTITLNFQPRTSVKIVGQRLHYHPTGYTLTQDAGGWAVNGGAADWYEQLLPLRNNGINYSIASGYKDWTTSLGTGDGQHALIQSLNFEWMLENVFSWWFAGPYTSARHVYGWAPSAGYSGGHADMPVYPHAGGLGVVGIGSDAAGTNTDNPGSGALIFGHELTHDYNIYHTNKADSCGSNDPNSNFPYTTSSIQEFGFNPFTGKIYDPALTHDLMSYCPSGGSKQGWISPFTWSTMFNNLVPAAALAVFSPSSAPANTLYITTATESLQVNATIFNPLYNPAAVGKLGNLYKTQSSLGYSLPKGPYAVELRNAAGATLGLPFTFGVNFSSEYSAHGETPTDAPPFPPEPTAQDDVAFIVPWDPATATIVLTFNGQIIDQKTVSPNAPQVLITSPSQPESWLAGSSHRLAWQGLDLDGDSLTYVLFYSNDAGATWSLLQNDISASFFDIPTDSLAGGSDVRFRVVATDGVNTGFDETHETISVPNKAPVATILNPEVQAFFQANDLVILQGIGVDLEDGTLPDESLVWSSSKDGTLGTGPSLALDTLTRGKHTITLTVTDSLGVHGSASVDIFLGYRTFTPIMRK